MRPDRQEIEQIYSRNAHRLYLASLRILGNSQEAEDVMQDTILKVCTEVETKDLDSIEAYLTRSCINRSLDIIRRRKREQNYLLAEKAGNSSRAYFQDSDDTARESENYSMRLRSRIISLIASLPRNCRQAVTLKLIEGYDYEEIAQITSMKETSIRSNYMRGRKKLQKLLEKEGIRI